MWKKRTMCSHGGGASSDPAKGRVKGHTSPAGAGEHPGGLMLACETKGEVPRCLLSEVATHCLENRSCPVPKDDTAGGAIDPERAGMGLGNFHWFHSDVGLCDPPGNF